MKGCPFIAGRTTTMRIRILTTLVSVAAVAAALSTPASAGGFLADVFVKPISPKAAKELDKAHAQMGNPLDHTGNAMAGAAANVVAPGSGAAVTTALEARDAERRKQ